RLMRGRGKCHLPRAQFWARCGTASGWAPVGERMRRAFVAGSLGEPETAHQRGGRRGFKSLSVHQELAWQLAADEKRDESATLLRWNSRVQIVAVRWHRSRHDLARTCGGVFGGTGIGDIDVGSPARANGGTLDSPTCTGGACSC